MISTVLNSWKEIAAYLHCGVRTVQRWEEELGLPIHRPSNKRGPAVAFTNELDRWLRRRSSSQEANPDAFAVTAGSAVTAGDDVEGKGLPSQPDPPTPIPKTGVLNSWKEIAAYLHCSSQTVRQWRSKFGLPVHQPNGRRGPVIGFTKELDEWLRQRSGQRKANAADLVATALLEDVYPELASELEGFRRRLAVHVARQNGTGTPVLIGEIRDLVCRLNRAIDDHENPEERYDGSLQQQEKESQAAIGQSDEANSDRAMVGFGGSQWVPAVAASTEDGAAFSGRAYISEKARESRSQFLRIGLNFAFTMINCAKWVRSTEKRRAAIEAACKTYRTIAGLRAQLPLEATVHEELTAGLEKLRVALQQPISNDEINHREPFCGFHPSGHA